MSELVDALASMIRNMSPGDRMPSEQQIMAKHGVSRASARSAVQQLEDLYLVRRVQGAGTFVNGRIDYLISRRQVPSFHKIVEAAGSEARTVFLDRKTLQAPPDVARALQIDESALCLRLQRLGYIDGFPACYFQEWFPTTIDSDWLVALRAYESVAETFRAGGFEPVRTRSVGTVDTATVEICQHLGLGRHRQTWFVESINTDRDTKIPLMLSRAWTRLDQVRMIFETIDE